ncbi:MAG: hypothetical protein AB6733_16135 [Clostridiaceae bacterium]
MRYLIIGLFAILSGVMFDKLVNFINAKHIAKHKENMPIKIKIHIYTIMVVFIWVGVAIIDWYII